MSKQSNHQPFNPNSSDYKARREAVQAEINQFKVKIDKSIFSKTPEEKAELKRVKAEYKKQQKALS
jgi:hypothetical protein